MHSP
ncbi:hypothetical protein CJF32_00009073 [Rutstroemia sp. NJR-2017a WRK4]|jgi:hypothetical protein